MSSSFKPSAPIYNEVLPIFYDKIGWVTYFNSWKLWHFLTLEKWQLIWLFRQQLIVSKLAALNLDMLKQNIS